MKIVLKKIEKQKCDRKKFLITKRGDFGFTKNKTL